MVKVRGSGKHALQCTPQIDDTQNNKYKAGRFYRLRDTDENQDSVWGHCKTTPSVSQRTTVHRRSRKQRYHERPPLQRCTPRLWRANDRHGVSDGRWRSEQWQQQRSPVHIRQRAATGPSLPGSHMMKNAVAALSKGAHTIFHAPPVLVSNTGSHGCVRLADAAQQ